MLEIFYKPSFLKQMNKLEKELIDEALEKIDIFRNTKNHPSLKVHKLHGKLSSYYSFSVNYKTRIVFEFVSKHKKSVVLVAIDDHDVYR